MLVLRLLRALWSRTSFGRLERQVDHLISLVTRPAASAGAITVRTLHGASAGASAGDLVAFASPTVRLDAAAPLAAALAQLVPARQAHALVYEADGSLAGVLEPADVLRHVLRGGDGVVGRALRTCVVADGDVPLREVARHLCTGARFVAVRHDRHGHRLVSRRALLRWALDQPDAAARRGSTLAALGLGRGQTLAACDERGSARAALTTMAACGVTSLPVLDALGHVAGVVSATDALHARADPSRLAMPVLAFVAASRAEHGTARDARCAVTCTLADTLADTIARMFAERVHHVYALDEHGLPVGVIAYVDILRVLSAWE